MRSTSTVGCYGMLRFTVKETLAQCRPKVVRHVVRYESGQTGSRKTGNFTKKLLGSVLVGGTVAAAATFGCAYNDSKFCQLVQENTIHIKKLFNLFTAPANAPDSAEATASIASTAGQSSSKNHKTVSADVPEFVPYLLIGAGTASYFAALTIRARDSDAIVLILGDENENVYSRTHLSKELWWYGEDNVADTLQYHSLQGRTRDVYFEVDGFYIKPSDWSKFPHGCISIIKNARVKRIDVANKFAVLESGQRIRFNKCLIATGSKPKILPEFKRPDLKDRIHTLYTIQDFRKINSIVPKSKDIAIIGNGFLASELAYSLKRRFRSKNNPKIYQVFAEDNILQEVLPSQICDDASKQLFKHGVNLINNSSVFDVSQTRDGRLRLILRDKHGSKREIFVDHIIDVSGSEPNVEIARQSGLELDKNNGGILVDSGMRARSDVFAAGDVSSFFDINLGRRRVEHTENAEITGRVAGENMTNGNRVYPRQASFNSVVGTDAHIFGVGRVDSKLKTVVVCAQQSQEFDEELRAVTFYVSNDAIVGVVLYNVFGDGILIARKLIEDKISTKNAADLARLFRLYPMPSDGDKEEKER